MSQYNYSALDAKGQEHKGSLNVIDQTEALSRIKQMGYFPQRIQERPSREKKNPPVLAGPGKERKKWSFYIGSGVRSRVLTTFTRQLATLVGAGLPLLRGLRLLEEQESNPMLKQVIHKIGTAIEGGSTLSEALAYHPKIFNKLFVNMVKAGETGGVLEIVLTRLAEFMEKTQKIKGKVVAAMFYPSAIIMVAIAILGILMAFVVPRFEDVFRDMMNGQPLPTFTLIVLAISRAIKSHILIILGISVCLSILFKTVSLTRIGRHYVDHLKLYLPGLGKVINKLAVSRFSRTLGTLVSSGVPILQSLSIVKETSGNVIIADAVAAVHDSVKKGETITTPLAASHVFPPMVIGMVDVGEQTGALPEMLMKVADNYDDEVDNAVSAMTSLLEPIMIVFLAVVVGSIVIALFMPLITMMQGIDGTNPEGRTNE